MSYCKPKVCQFAYKYIFKSVNKSFVDLQHFENVMT